MPYILWFSVFMIFAGLTLPRTSGMRNPSSSSHHATWAHCVLALQTDYSLFYYFLLWTGDETFSAPYLVLVPGSSLFYPWTFLTSAFVESTVIEVSLSLIH